MRERLRIGAIGYLNALPFFHGLEENLAGFLKPQALDVTWVEGVPSEINRKLSAGEIDCGLISSLAAAGHENHCYVVPGLAIGSRLASRSVLLWSKLALGELDGKDIAVTRASFSSRALLQILLARRFHFHNRFVECDAPASQLAAMGTPAFLVIGDEALFFDPGPAWKRYDLAKLWWQWQGVPFCFAVWAFHERLVEDAPAAASALQRALRLTLSRNLKRLPEILEESGRFARSDPEFAAASRYLRELLYRMNHPLREGLFRFFALAEQEGLLDSLGTLNFLSKEEAFQRDRLKNGTSDEPALRR